MTMTINRNKKMIHKISNKMTKMMRVTVKVIVMRVVVKIQKKNKIIKSKSKNHKPKEREKDLRIL